MMSLTHPKPQDTQGVQHVLWTNPFLVYTAAAWLACAGGVRFLREMTGKGLSFGLRQWDVCGVLWCRVGKTSLMNQYAPCPPSAAAPDLARSKAPARACR